MSPDLLPLTDKQRRRLTVASNGCWEWSSTHRTTGYGFITLPGRRFYLMHRYAYEALVGPIPDGKQIDHLCRNRACCNPEHLEPVTIQENIRRGEGPQAINARKTHCIRGHALSGDNLYLVPKSGRRNCVICRQAASNRADERRRAA